MADWDVGITALGVAAASNPDGRVTIPYAEVFVHAARAPAPIPSPRRRPMATRRFPGT
jgi:hypothetical protein